MIASFRIGRHSVTFCVAGAPRAQAERETRSGCCKRGWAQTGSRIFRPIRLAFLADAYAADDTPGLAHRTFEEALRIASETGERWAEPEIHRLVGDLLTRRGPSTAAIASYERAIAVARGQGSRSFELRATTSLARVLSDQGRHAEAHDRLRNIYRFFDARCGAADLADAKILLDELPSASQTS